MFLRKFFVETGRRRISVYPVLTDKFGYTSQDASYLLDRFNDLNNLPGTLIGVSNKKKIEAYSKQNGNFVDLEDLLRVHGIGAKSIKRICDKLISIKGDPEVSENIQRNTTKRFKLPIISPPLSESQASIIKTVGSVNIGDNEITWAKINCVSKNLENWECFSLESYSSLKKIDLITLITLCKDVVEKLPVCDTYVLEDISISNYSGSSMSRLPKNLLTTITTTLIHQPPISGLPKLILIGGRAVAKWSGRLVGSEKISSQSILSNIIIKLNGDGISSGTNKASLPLLYAEPNLRSFYHGSMPATREALADAVLLGLSFIDLAINKKESWSDR